MIKEILTTVLLASICGVGQGAFASSYGEIQAIPTPTTKATFSANTNGIFTPLASATDMVVFSGSSSKIVKIQQIYIQYETQYGGSDYYNHFYLIKRSSANSGGTTTTETIVPFDSNNSAATAVMKSYRSGSNPTLGSSVGSLWDGLIFGATRGIFYPGHPQSSVKVFDAMTFGQPIVLRGNSESICLNNNATTVVGSSSKIGMMIVFTEE